MVDHLEKSIFFLFAFIRVHWRLNSEFPANRLIFLPLSVNILANAYETGEVDRE